MGLSTEEQRAQVELWLLGRNIPPPVQAAVRDLCRDAAALSDMEERVDKARSAIWAARCGIHPENVEKYIEQTCVDGEFAAGVRDFAAYLRGRLDESDAGGAIEQLRRYKKEAGADDEQ